MTVDQQMRYGKSPGATSFVAVPVEKYNSLTEGQREEIRRFDPFLRQFYQVGVGEVFIFWLDEKQMELIENIGADASTK